MSESEVRPGSEPRESESEVVIASTVKRPETSAARRFAGAASGPVPQDGGSPECGLVATITASGEVRRSCCAA
jgi:hypothetical protein